MWISSASLPKLARYSKSNASAAAFAPPSILVMNLYKATGEGITGNDDSRGPDRLLPLAGLRRR
ncbi:MAG UNVERIFIED_CONTAM: hypothetical protein LVR18_08865 [Planctomycetaceae bacterium]